MRLMIQTLTKKILWVIFFTVVLTSCAKQETQFFIFKRYDSEKDNWNYYKTDLYAPSHITEIEIPPCYSDDKRIQPIWSPNGQYYGCSAVYDRPLVIYNTNNEIIAKLEQGNPKDPLMWWILDWSPDSQYLSIMNTGSGEKPYYDFSIMKYDGSSLQQIDKQTNASMSFGGVWAPNGRYIVRQVRPNSGEHDYLVISSPSGREIFRFDLTEFIHTPIVFAEQLKWSPDNRKLAFRTYYNMDVDSKLYVLDIESGEVADIIPDKSICIMNISDWSPDSKTMLFDAIDCEKHISGDIDTVYYSINVDGSELKPLTGKGVGTLNWTWDGKSIIVSGYHDISSKGMYIMDVDGRNKRILLDSGDFVSWITP